jgi:hypothetical protein
MSFCYCWKLYWTKITFKVGDIFYKPDKRVTIGSPVSRLAAKIFLQMYGNPLVKNIPEDKTITLYVLYNMYVDNILLIYDCTRRNPGHISTRMNKLHKNVQFKFLEGNDTISYWDLLTTRNPQHLEIYIYIYCKPATTDMTIYNDSNHLTEHTLEAYRSVLNIKLWMPMSSKFHTEN